MWAKSKKKKTIVKKLQILQLKFQVQFHNIVIASSYSKKAETQINCIFKRKNECIKKITDKLR